MSRLEKLAVGDLHPAGDNPRFVVEVDDEMVATVKSLGVLEPLLVNKSSVNGYTVIAGHRRLSAAKKAGLKFVPCVIHDDLSDRDRAEMMLVENLQREDLSPIEEAGAYRRLVELGHKQRDLAKIVGRSQSHISKRTALLRLPEAALKALDAGGITIEQAVALTAVPVDAVAKLFDARRAPSGYEIQAAIREAERQREQDKIRKDLVAQGITVLDKEPGPAHSHRLTTYGLGLTPAEHAGEPCHIAVLSSYRGEAVFWCTSPERHLPDGDSALKVPEDDEDEDEEPTPPAGETEEQRTHREAAAAVRAKESAERAERDADYQRRREFCAHLIDGVPAAGYMGFVATMWILSGEPAIDGAAELLGVELPSGWDEKPGALAAWVNTPNSGPPGNAGRAMYALALAFGLGQTKGTYFDDVDEPILRPFFDHLASQGYELSDLERQLPGVDDGDVVGAHGEDLDDLDPPSDEHEAQITPVGRGRVAKKWRLVCSCGFEAQQTTEDLARERHKTHVAELDEVAS